MSAWKIFFLSLVLTSYTMICVNVVLGGIYSDSNLRFNVFYHILKILSNIFSDIFSASFSLPSPSAITIIAMLDFFHYFPYDSISFSVFHPYFCFFILHSINFFLNYLPIPLIVSLALSLLISSIEFLVLAIVFFCSSISIWFLCLFPFLCQNTSLVFYYHFIKNGYFKLVGL